MTDYSKMTDEQVNEAIFKAKGWVEAQQYPKLWHWLKHEQSPDSMTIAVTITNDIPDYTHSWELCGDLLEEMLNCSLRRWGDKWCCGFYDDKGYLVNQATVHDTPQRAICEAWLAWKERG